MAANAFKNKLPKVERVPSQRNYKDNDLSNLQASMDLKMKEMEDSKEGDQSKPHIVNDVMDELEQRNLEMASLLKSSEKNRSDLEEMIKEHNKDITSHRANTLVMYSLDDNVAALSNKEQELKQQLTELESVVVASKRNEKSLHQKIKDLIQLEQQRAREFSEKVLDLTKKLTWTEEQIAEKDHGILKSEKTLQELFDMCEQLGESNTHIKNELHNCSTSGNHMRETNRNLQYCKEYLEGQVDNVVKEFKTIKSVNEKLKLEIANMAADNRNHKKKYSLMSEKVQGNKEDMVLLREKLKEAENVMNHYDSGEIKSNVVLNEIKKDKQMSESVIKNLQKKIKNLEIDIESGEDKIKKFSQIDKRMDAKLSDMEVKINDYRENYIEQSELESIKKEMQVRHRLDMNTQKHRVGAVLQNDQLDLIKAIKDTLLAKKDSKDKEELKASFFA